MTTILANELILNQIETTLFFYKFLPRCERFFENHWVDIPWIRAWFSSNCFCQLCECSKNNEYYNMSICLTIMFWKLHSQQNYISRSQVHDYPYVMARQSIRVLILWFSIDIDLSQRMFVLYVCVLWWVYLCMNCIICMIWAQCTDRITMVPPYVYCIFVITVWLFYLPFNKTYMT